MALLNCPKYGKQVSRFPNTLNVSEFLPPLLCLIGVILWLFGSILLGPGFFPYRGIGTIIFFTAFLWFAIISLLDSRLVSKGR